MSEPDYVTELRRWEGVVPWMYLDTRGYVTIGVGNMVPTVEAACGLALWNHAAERRASTSEIVRSFVAVQSMRAAMPADNYRLTPRLELPAEDIDVLLRQRIGGEFLPGLEKLFPGFGGFPGPARSALMDMAFNLGLGRDATADHPATGLRQFSRLRAAVAARDWARASGECRRSSSRTERNDWCRRKFLEAAQAVVA